MIICRRCRKRVPAGAFCVKCGVFLAHPQAYDFDVNRTITPSLRYATKRSSCSRVSYVLLAFFLGAFGIHNFYAGYTGRAIAQLFITLFIGWTIIPLFALSIWVLVEICVVTRDSEGYSFS